MKNSKIANINIRLKGLFKQWLVITRVFHKLTEQQMSILALLLYYHYILKQDITNEKILWKMVFDYDTKLKIRNELNISDQAIQNTLNILRKKNIIKSNRITPTYIPELEKDSTNFKIIFNFNIVHE